MWSFDLVMKVLVKQLLLGFEIELYEQVDIPAVLFYLEYFNLLMDRNNNNYIAKFDPYFIKTGFSCHSLLAVSYICCV